ncbi:hypothetical protein [Kitasatospora griseola]
MLARLAKIIAVAAPAFTALIAAPAAFDSVSASSADTVTVADGSLGWG